MTSAQRLELQIDMRKLFGCGTMLPFHLAYPSIFYQGAFIFQDGSIWVAR